MSKQYLDVLKECVIETGKNSLRYLDGPIDAGSKASHKELAGKELHQEILNISKAILYT
ncbi:hypothetical protein JI735_16770 [Paenibacillus sonchi]|uniref:Uncharacterized protein n=1 Tax=Paenibacillus sonchi TaxID=373687 RepID=A0A974PH76_9BACL|nr:hypothetical protein [Paenibacillus sonchi]QQZ63919.1 hypothetical protein JI735_16770 [Paenibacillus sonchi]